MGSLLCLLLLTTGLIPLTPALAAEEQPGAYPSLAEWWEGEGLLAPGAGPLKGLKAEGLELGGKYYGALFGIQNSAGGAASPWDDGGQLNLSLNAGRLLQIPTLQKLKFNLQGRWRVKHHDGARGQGAVQATTDLLHQHPVLQLEGGQHRAGGDPAGLQHQPAQHERKEHPGEQ
jgi:hypothetical protein